MLARRIGQSPSTWSALFAIILFSVTIGGTFVYDDVYIIREDARIQDPTQWGRFWTQPYSTNVDKLYRPLTSMSLAIQWWLSDGEPRSFHIFNILMHALAAALVAELARRLIGVRTAWVAGLLFAVHPLHVEPVAYVVGRAELMCTVGFLGAMILMLAPMKPARAVAIGGCFLLSVLSKEQGLLLPPMLGLLWIVRRRFAFADSKNGRLWLLVMLTWLPASYIIFRESMIGFWWERHFIDWSINPMVVSPDNPHGGSVGLDRILLPLAFLGKYTQLLIVPLKLSPDYGAMVFDSTIARTNPFIWIGVAVVCVWTILFIVAARHRDKVTMLLLVALAATYGMIGNIAALIAIDFAERLIYLPSAFFILLIALWMIRWPRSLLAGFVAVLVVLGCVRSFTYAQRWNDRIGFYESALRDQPKAIRLYILLSEAQMHAGQLDQAKEVIQRGCELAPDYWQLWRMRGTIAIERGEFDDALQSFDRAWALTRNLEIVTWQSELGRRMAATQPTTRP